MDRLWTRSGVAPAFCLRSGAMPIPSAALPPEAPQAIGAEASAQRNNPVVGVGLTNPITDQQFLQSAIYGSAVFCAECPESIRKLE